MLVRRASVCNFTKLILRSILSSPLSWTPWPLYGFLRQSHKGPQSTNCLVKYRLHPPFTKTQPPPCTPTKSKTSHLASLPPPITHNFAPSSSVSPLPSGAKATIPFFGRPLGSPASGGTGFLTLLRVPSGVMVQLCELPPCQCGGSSPMWKGADATLRMSFMTLGAKGEALRAAKALAPEPGA